MSIKLLFQSCIKQKHKSDYIDISSLKIHFDMISLPIFSLQHFKKILIIHWNCLLAVIL